MPAKKKTATKKTTIKKAPAKKTAAKRAASTKAAVKKTAAKKSPPTQKTVQVAKAKKKATPKKVEAKPSLAALKKAQVSRTELGSEKKSGPIVFSLDDIEELMASKKSKKPEVEKSASAAKKAFPEVAKPAKPVVENKPIEKRVHSAASLADILGFNPAEKKQNTQLDHAQIPAKLKKYYKLLIDLRRHVSEEINLHTSETLKHSSREDSGDLSGYGSHQADAATDSFDRDFALSLVSSEQEALNEIEEAIQRIKKGTYGVCEVTGKAIPAARLTAVPFARYSVEGQAEHERNQQRRHNRSIATGIFGDVTDGPKIQTDDDDGDE